MSSAIHAVSGAAAGVVAMSLTYPLIFLSTRAAVQVKQEDKSTYEAIKDIVKSEGVLGLYSGLTSSLFGIAITNGVYYYFYEGSRDVLVRRKVKGSSQALSTAESMLAGLIAGSATSLVVNPLWVVQAVQSTASLPPSASSTEKPLKVGTKLSVIDTVKHILQTGGVSAFWRGIGPALVLVINPIIQYTVFEQLKNWLIARRTAKSRAVSGAAAAVAVLSDMDFFFLGALSKLVATSATYPYIVIKSRLQAGHASAKQYKSALDGVLTVLKTEGPSGLYKGIGNKLIQSVLTAAILFAGQKRIYEMTQTAMAVVKA